MIKKLSIIILAAVLFLTACVRQEATESPKKSAGNMAKSATMAAIEEDKTTMAETVTGEVDKAVKAGVSKINSAASEAISQIQEAKTEKLIPDPKKIPLNIVKKTDFGDLKITAVRIDYEYKELQIYYESKLKVISPIPGTHYLSAGKDSELINNKGVKEKIIGYGSKQISFSVSDISATDYTLNIVFVEISANMPLKSLSIDISIPQ